VQALQPSPVPTSNSSTVVKFVTASQPVATQKIVQATASNQQMTKLVVVCMANSGSSTCTTQVLVFEFLDVPSFYNLIEIWN
jgi:hypothetical protein